MTRQEKARRIQEILEARYAVVDIPLAHQDPFTLLVAVVLSAQTTDKKVNEVTPALFARARDAGGDGGARRRGDPDLIRRIGLRRRRRRASSASPSSWSSATAAGAADVGGARGAPRRGPQDRLGGAAPGVRPAGLPGGHPHPPAGGALGTVGRQNVEQTERDLKRVFPEESLGQGPPPDDLLRPRGIARRSTTISTPARSAPGRPRKGGKRRSGGATWPCGNGDKNGNGDKKTALKGPYDGGKE